MSENKTKPTEVSVEAYIDAVPNEARREDARTLLALLTEFLIVATHRAAARGVGDRRHRSGLADQAVGDPRVGRGVRRQRVVARRVEAAAVPRHSVGLSRAVAAVELVVGGAAGIDTVAVTSCSP